MSVRRNTTALYFVLLANYILPFLTLPYFSRTLGPSGFGILGLAQTISQILMIFTDFGFDLTSTRKIAIALKDKQEVTKIYWTTITAKSIFACLSAIVMLVLAFTVFNNPGESEVICVAILMLLGSVLTPNWLFQGIQKMPLVGFCAVAARLAMFPLMFIFVKSSHDLVSAAFLQFSPMVFAGLALSAITYRMRLVAGFPKLSFVGLIEDIRDASHIFFSDALTSVYMYANVIFLRGIAGINEVGYYVAAEKLITALRRAFTPPVQAYFPKACALYSEGRFAEVKKAVYSLVALYLLLAVFGFIGFQILGQWFVEMLFGEKFVETFSVLRALLLVPIWLGISTAFSQLCIIATGNQARLKKVYAIGVVFHLIQTPIMVYLNGAVGAGYSVFVTTLLIMIMLGFISQRTFKTLKEQQIVGRQSF